MYVLKNKRRNRFVIVLSYEPTGINDIIPITGIIINCISTILHLGSSL